MTTGAVKGRKRQVLAVTAILLVVCNVAVWLMMQRQYQHNAHASIEQETTLSQQRADDLADSIRRNLNYIDGIPQLLSELIRVKAAVTRFGDSAVSPALSVENRRVRWNNDRALNDLSQYFEHVKSRLRVDIIYLVNASGDCIAASNWDTLGSTVGSNFAERSFFRSNRLGQHGMQYAMGKTTHIPGLYFSSPVMINGKFMGAVVAKVDVPNLSFLIKQSEAFVTDSNGVIILAHEKERELSAFPDAPVTLMSEQDRQARYLRTELPELQLQPWGDRLFPGLLRMQGKDTPQILAVAALPEFGLNVYVESGLNDYKLLREQYFWFTVLLNALGSTLLLSLCGLVLYFQSVKRSKAMLWTQANFDMLTGLPNRAMFNDRLEQELKKADRARQLLGLLMIDLDRFKEVNDTLGHAMGDLLLKEASRRMVQCLRESDTVARLGGDEFTVILPMLSDARDTEEVAQKIIAALASPFDLHGHVASVSASIGIAIYPNDGPAIDKLVRAADHAMYQSKRMGRNCFSYYEG
ncbi:MAG: diguanylate cyclase [Nitrosomonadales bacterium]|nr:diguanylate cyclase [Nitrosomonadales bacterium]